MSLIFLLSFAFFFSLFVFVNAKISEACMTVLVGKKASSAGEVLVAHNEDAPGRFTMQTHLVKKQRRRSGTKIKFEPELSDLSQSATRTNLFWSEAKTFSDDTSDSAFCDFYVNGYGVVICSNNCANSREDEPELQNGGIGYGLRRMVAETARTAKEALDFACKLVSKYGYASGGRSYAFADKDEIYVMQIVHGKHYAIQRVPDDEVCVIPNHYTIHEADKKARGYDELVSYAVKRGWYKPEDGDFDFARVYQSEDSFGLEKNTHRHVRAFEILLEIDLSGLLQQKWESLPFSIKPAHKVTIETLKKILRTHFEDTSSYSHEGNPHFSKPLTICNCDTLESTIAEIRHNPDRIILRRALGRPCFSPYIVWYCGITLLPEGYEERNADASLANHFLTRPSDMDYKNNAWFRAMEFQAACDILYSEKGEYVRSKIAEFESKEEEKLITLDPQIELRLRNNPYVARAMMEAAVISWTGEADDMMNEMKHELGIITAEALDSVRAGEAFRIRIPEQDFRIKECICGPSYKNQSEWSKCTGINENGKYTELEFDSGSWFEDAVPCFTDLYMKMTDENGKIHAGTVRIQVQKF